MPGSLDRKSPTGWQLTGRGRTGMAETYQQRLKVIGLLPPGQNGDLAQLYQMNGLPTRSRCITSQSSPSL